MIIDRIELADLANPTLLAKAVIEQLPDNLELPIPVRDIATALDIINIQAMTTSGFEGGLITDSDKSSGYILINENNAPRRQRFTIGHELGHYLNPWHKPSTEGKFLCKAQDMVVSGASSNTQQKMEIEANQFSSALLMPDKFMNQDLRHMADPDISHIVSLADKYDVSKESMGRRYAELQDEPCAIVFSQNGKLIYSVKGQDFPQLSIRQKGESLPLNCLTKGYTSLSGESSDWQECASDIWLRNAAEYESVYEQVLPQTGGYRITMLTLGEEIDEDEEDLQDSWRPQFYR